MNHLSDNSVDRGQDRWTQAETLYSGALRSRAFHLKSLQKGSLGLGLAVCASMALAAEPVQLDEMVVSAAGYEQEVVDAPASISVITREDLEKRPFKDVTDALSDVPGVVVTGGGSSADISMRGMGGKYTLILIDGKRQSTRETRPNSDGPGIEQGWIPPLSAIERIEVVRGPMSSLYGSDALGGVINIITRKVAPEWGGEISAETILQEDDDSGDERRTNFYVNGPMINDKLGLQVYGQYSERDEDEILNGYSDQSNGNINGKMTWMLSKDQTLKFEAGHSRQRRATNPGKSSPTSGRGSDPTDVVYERDNFGLTHEFSSDIGQHDTYYTYDETDNPTRDMNYQEQVLNHKSVFNLTNQVLTIGAQYDKQELTDGGNQTGTMQDLTRWQMALFAEDEYFLTDSLAITTGLRYNRDENYGSAWTPRIYGVWHVDDQWTLKGGISSGYRSPDLRQATDGWGQATGGRGGNAVIVGNSDLEAEKSVTGEIGVNWQNYEGVQLGLTVYHTTYEDKITEDRYCDVSNGDASCVYMGHDYDFISTRYNVDEVVMRGVEATASLPLTDTLELGANYTYTDSEQRSGDFKGEPLNRLPKHMFNASLDWTPSYELNVWSRLNFRGRSSEGLSRTSMVEEVPSYTFVDVGLRYRLTDSTTFYTGVYNLLDKDVYYDKYNKVLDGRRYQAKIQYNF